MNFIAKFAGGVIIIMCLLNLFNVEIYSEFYNKSYCLMVFGWWLICMGDYK